MSQDRYVVQDQHMVHFLTMTVIHWIDVFTRPVYKHIICDSLNYCVREKGLVLFGWVLMSNHLHLIARVDEPHTMTAFLRDFKKFTSKAIVAAIESTPESRRLWLLDKFSFEARRTHRAEQFKVWQDGNHAILLESQKFLLQKLHYLHDNPVRQELVANPEEYLYSSAPDYAGRKGLVQVELI
ncbi:transposase [Rhabdobacter roseus]|uniref:REP element-mobilizing transposase RayT n=1 Tax=Rhabdobacter roseus TaxID=1655419 RepID=A0A840TSS4_9BACT|nr:transposase [Rhabdobacter roseus]MBB5286344.1 REP element-mobilizing transposase RayT [Rhabdobacter roseus]